MSAIQVTTKIPFARMATYLAMFAVSNTILIQGQPGIGKTSLLTTLREHPDFKDHAVGIVDCANLSLGDLAMPVVDAKALVTHYAPNVAFNIQADTPVILLLDEIGKASREVINMLLPLLLERRLGSVHLAPGSLVFATTNMQSDALGDKFPPHALNRVTRITMAPPTADDWIQWGANNGMAPDLLALVKLMPVMLIAYDDAPDVDNPYIFNPKRGNISSFVSPRSLAHMNPYVQAYRSGALPDEDYVTFGNGTIGEPAMSQLHTLSQLSSKLPGLDEIRANPEAALKKLTALEESGLSASHLLAATLAQNIPTQDAFVAQARFMKMLPNPEPTLLYQMLMLNAQRTNPQLRMWHQASTDSRELSALLADLAS